MDTDKIDKAVLALLYLNHRLDGPAKTPRSWKSLDWETMARLHEQGAIEDPANKAKSVLLSKDGFQRAKAAFQDLFETDRDDRD